jgi:hypothetical protein
MAAEASTKAVLTALAVSADRIPSTLAGRMINRAIYPRTMRPGSDELLVAGKVAADRDEAAAIKAVIHPAKARIRRTMPITRSVSQESERDCMAPQPDRPSDQATAPS